ncbi:DNA mismatch repair endonuclease MutL [Treponema sp. C6A8]|uniref:DNA mismatch repair endonuclease MutL n=1 Tax=Treponema sp. C6A8 TaxID=1410609 RepID=UPI000481F327|nr:DNA mismatch repair endonuclease MutL [Treponema sp. C6A8]
MSLEHPVKTLNAEVARKIAAGEVIDRPNAIIRELIDNAIDSGAKNITVEISGGGIEKIRIVDDGCGMTRDDLQNCARPHATSKIATEVDLMNLTTLGFRGEALASIAAVSRLSITSGGFKMRASITEDHIIEPAPPVEGTIVQAEGLFENFPARRQFLKRPATEGMMCKNTFIEKALCKTDISFRFIQDGEIKIDLPAGQTQKERFVFANSYSEDLALFNQIENTSSHFTDENPDWKFTVIIGEPAVSRSNKKDIFIYVNGRRIQEYSLVQAIEYGGQGYFPNGTYPVAAAFIDVAPSLVDFNIHPAKKEARFYDISDLHHGLSSTIKAFFLKYTQANFAEDKPTDFVRELSFGESTISETKPSYENHISYKNYSHTGAGSGTSSGVSSGVDFRSRLLGGGSQTHTSSSQSLAGGAFKTSSLAEQALSISEGRNTSEESLIPRPDASAAASSKIKFIGSCLGTFLLVEKNSTLYFIDQHAVHERILFDKLMNNQGKSQPLLIPYKIKTDSKSQDNQLEKLKDALTSIGFTTKKIQDGEWEITSIPERWTGTEYDLRTLLFVKHVEPKEIIRSIAAMTACKAAVKDGYVLDDQTAAELAEKAFTLEDPHCPHGRPIYTTITREQLFALVKRT